MTDLAGSRAPARLTSARFHESRKRPTVERVCRGVFMSLVFTGKNSSNHLQGTSLEAYDAVTDKPVVVIMTHEAERDHGLDRVQEVACAKYARKLIEADGTVRVSSTDCRDH